MYERLSQKTSIGLYHILVISLYIYKIGLTKISVHHTYEINISWASFNEEISNVKYILMKNMHSG